MKNKLSLGDWELVSQYIDNELSQKERSRLEGRLQKEPALRLAVEQMRQTRQLVRSLPKVRAPRRYTLTPEMLPQPAWILRLLPTFQLASALATILFVLVVASDLFGFLSATSQDSFLNLRAAEPAASFDIEAMPTPTTPSFFLEAEEESAAPAAQDLMEAQAPEEMFAEEPVQEGVVEEAAPETPFGQIQDSETPPGVGIMNTDMPSLEAGVDERGLTENVTGGGQLTPVVSPEPGTENTATPTPSPEPTPTPTPTPALEDDLGAELQEEPGDDRRGLSPEVSRILVRVIEVSLAAAATIFAALAIWLRRQSL